MLLHGSPAAVVTKSIKWIVGSREKKTGASDLRLHGGVLDMWRFSHLTSNDLARYCVGSSGSYCTQAHKGMVALMYYGMIYLGFSSLL